jgi:phage gp46-like protein
MPDIRLVQNRYFPKYDVTVDWNLLATGALDDTQALASAVIVALGTNRLAENDDVLPDPDSTDRMGWWGDLDTEEIWGGWPIGTRLWLLRRTKITDASASIGSTLTNAESYIREAVQPFVDLKIASRIDIEVSRVGIERIDALVRIYRGPQQEVELRFQMLWDELPQLAIDNPYNPPSR